MVETAALLVGNVFREQGRTWSGSRQRAPSERVCDTAHALVFQEILPRERDQLFLGRVIHDLVPSNARSR